MADAPAPTPTTSAPVKQTVFRVTDVADGKAFLELDDGRHIAASVKDGLEGVKRGSKVKITSEGDEKEGTPKNPVVTSLA